MQQKPPKKYLPYLISNSFIKEPTPIDWFSTKPQLKNPNQANASRKRKPKKYLPSKPASVPVKRKRKRAKGFSKDDFEMQENFKIPQKNKVFQIQSGNQDSFQFKIKTHNYLNQRLRRSRSEIMVSRCFSLPEQLTLALKNEQKRIKQLFGYESELCVQVMALRESKPSHPLIPCLEHILSGDLWEVAEHRSNLQQIFKTYYLEESLKSLIDNVFRWLFYIGNLIQSYLNFLNFKGKKTNAIYKQLTSFPFDSKWLKAHLKQIIEAFTYERDIENLIKKQGELRSPILCKICHQKYIPTVMKEHIEVCETMVDVKHQITENLQNLLHLKTSLDGLKCGVNLKHKMNGQREKLAPLVDEQGQDLKNMIKELEKNLVIKIKEMIQKQKEKEQIKLRTQINGLQPTKESPFRGIRELIKQKGNQTDENQVSSLLLEKFNDIVQENTQMQENEQEDESQLGILGGILIHQQAQNSFMKSPTYKRQRTANLIKNLQRGAGKNFVNITIPLDDEEDLRLFDSILVILLKYIEEAASNPLALGQNFDFMICNWLGIMINKVKSKIKGSDCLIVLESVHILCEKRVQLTEEFRELNQANIQIVGLPVGSSNKDIRTRQSSLVSPINTRRRMSIQANSQELRISNLIQKEGDNDMSVKRSFSYQNHATQLKSQGSVNVIQSSKF